MKFILGSALWLLSAGCARNDAPPVIFVSIQPQAWFVERIAGPSVEVRVLIGPGESPATYDPTPRRLTRLAQARALLTIGVPMERALLPDLGDTMPDLRIYRVQDGIPLQPAVPHVHDPHDGHDHATGTASAMDSHIWLDPVHALVIARNTYDALAQVMPAESAEMSRRLDTLLEELRDLDRDMAEILAPVRGRILAVFHPAYGYLARRYGLQQLAIETGGMAPSPRGLARVMRRIEEGNAGAIFVQPQFSSGQAKSLAEATGLQVRTLDPLARDYAANMRAIAREIASALKSEDPR